MNENANLEFWNVLQPAVAAWVVAVGVAVPVEVGPAVPVGVSVEVAAL